ncbi:MAG: chloride channel protein [Gemmatimonadetes bacterium]|nr:chloride channel protein [Gemmatimonadota bacterium]MBK7784174.1 chloride channel protein [Gemmatimonadota bacterium]
MGHPIHTSARLHLLRLGTALPRLWHRLGLGETALVVLVSAATGLLAGGAIVGFYRLLALAADLAAAVTTRLPLADYAVQAGIVLLGLTLARLLVRYGAHDSPGENVPDLMRVVARGDGDLPERPILAKTVASAIILGTGGSIGAEGPVAVLGAGTASTWGRWLGLGPERLRLLVGCGAAAGISGAFGAPIAGLFFATEKILGGLAPTSLTPVIVASATAAAVSHNFMPPGHALIGVPAGLGTGLLPALWLSALVGIGGGALGAGYSRIIWGCRDALRRMPMALRLLLAAGAVAGAYALFGSDRLGVGAFALTPLAGHAAGWLLLAALTKMIITGLCVAAAEVGGLFAPALVTGGLAGAALGQLAIASGLAPAGSLPAFALLGMAALVAGSAHAPLTAIFIVLELSGDWGLILPLLLSAALALVVARGLNPESVYTEWLARRGVHIAHGTDEGLLSRLRVAEAMSRNATVLLDTLPAGLALAQVEGSSQLEFPLVDARGHLTGMLTVVDWRRASRRPQEELAGPIATVASPAGSSVVPADTLLTTLRRLSEGSAALLPVVDPATGVVLGAIGRREVFAAYERARA